MEVVAGEESRGGGEDGDELGELVQVAAFGFVGRAGAPLAGGALLSSATPSTARRHRFW